MEGPLGVEFQFAESLNAPSQRKGAASCKTDSNEFMGPFSGLEKRRVRRDREILKENYAIFRG